LGEYLKEVPTRGEALQYAKAVKEKNNEYKIYNLMLDTASNKYNNSSERLEHIRKKIEEIENNMHSELQSYEESYNAAFNDIDKAFNKKKHVTGISTGFKELDDYTNGLQSGELIILGARPSMGKTMLANNIAENIAFNQKLPVAFFSLEMTAKSLCLRSIARFSKIPLHKILKGTLDENDWHMISVISSFCKAGKMFINDKCNISVQEMRSYSRKIKNLHGLSAIFVDYLGLINGEGENETIKLGNISRELKTMAKDLNVPVFCLVQLNRDLEKRNDKHPLMCDIRQSGNIEQDADLILFLHREDRNDVTTHLDIAKQRNGKTGRIILRAKNELMQFEDSIY
jgi:replicative DNA helicase